VKMRYIGEPVSGKATGKSNPDEGEVGWTQYLGLGKKEWTDER